MVPLAITGTDLVSHTVSTFIALLGFAATVGVLMMPALVKRVDVEPAAETAHPDKPVG